MTKKLLAAVMVAFALTACGGGDNDSIVATPATPVAPAPLPVVVPDVTFTNVATSPSKTSVMPGERDVEAAAFRMAWLDQNHYPISQLVFTNKSTENLWAMFKDFKLVDAAGNDVKNEAPYDMRRDDQTHEVVVNFYASSWFPNDFGVVSKTYSLLVSLDPLAPVGTTFAFELSAVQMHDAGKTVVSEVRGGEFKVMNVAGVGLPIITTVSPSYFSTPNTPTTNTYLLTAGSFMAYCPKENTYACTLMEMKFYAYGTSEPLISVDGMIYVSSRDTNNMNDFVLTSFWYSIAPGQSKTFTILASSYQQNVVISILDMTWMVGAEQTKVNSVVPTGPGSCGLIVSDNKSCKG